MKVLQSWKHAFNILKPASDDFSQMLSRARKAGVRSMIITGGNLQESKEAIESAQQHSKHPVKGSSYAY